jgi:perosamine synthetase
MSAPDIDDADVREVIEVLRSGRLALGPKACEFERQLADYVGARHAVAVSSGTAALHLIVRGLGLGPGDEVLTPSFTFVASVNALLYEGVRPVLVDIDPETFCLDPDALARARTPRTKAVMAVDVFGHPADWDRILGFADAHGLRVIDDACEALGAEHAGRRLGQLGAATAFAFYPNKQITTGEGGMLVTGSAELAEAARSLRNQGRSEMGAWLSHERLGFNYRMDEMSAALGLSQLRRIGTLLDKRARVARAYTGRLRGLDRVRPPVERRGVRTSWFVYVVTLAPGLDRAPVMAAMEARGVPVRGYFSPVHLQPYARGCCTIAGEGLPVTEAVARRTIALPFHGNLTEAEIDRVVDVLDRAVRETHAAG